MVRAVHNVMASFFNREKEAAYWWLICAHLSVENRAIANGIATIAVVIPKGEKSRSTYNMLTALCPGVIRDAIWEYAGMKYPRRWQTSMPASVCIQVTQILGKVAMVFL